MMDSTLVNPPASPYRPRSASVGSVDITDLALKDSIPADLPQDVRRRHVQGLGEKASPSSIENDSVKADVVEKYFLPAELCIPWLT